MPDEPRFEQVYAEHFRFVWRSLRRLGVPEDDAADAAQDVFLVVHRRLDDFEGRSKVTTWLFSICMRVARDRRRSAHVRRRGDSEIPLEETPDERVDVGADAERRQAARLLEHILDTMSEEQRVVFTLFELEGLGGDAIAEMLGIPSGTVHSRLRLAREAFQRGLARVQARDRFRASSDTAAADPLRSPVHDSGLRSPSAPPPQTPRQADREEKAEGGS